MINYAFLKIKGVISITVFFTFLQCSLIPAGALGERRKKPQAGGKIRSSAGKNTNSLNTATAGNSALPEMDGSSREGTKSILKKNASQTEQDNDNKIWSSGGEAVRSQMPPATVGSERTNGLYQGRKGLGTWEAHEQEEILPDHSPSLANDGQGTVYLVFEHGNELWWASDKGSGWVHNGKLPGQGGMRPVVVYIPGLFEQGASNGKDQSTIPYEDAGQAASGQPEAGGLFCVFESLESPRKIMSSVGKLAGEEVIWSEPQPLTMDDHSDFGLALCTDSDRNPLVLWLQQGSPETDDADLYYQVITVADSHLVWPDRLESALTQQQSGQSQQQEQSGTPKLKPDPTIPVFPFGDADCLGRILCTGSSLVPRFIPVIGGVHNYQLWATSCVPAVFSPGAATAGLPLSSTSLGFGLLLLTSMGRHITTGTIGSVLIQRNVPPGPALPQGGAPSNSSETSDNPQNTSLSNVYTVSGAGYISYLSFPLPLCINHVPVGKMRLGVMGQTGLQGIVTLGAGYAGQQGGGYAGQQSAASLSAALPAGGTGGGNDGGGTFEDSGSDTDGEGAFSGDGESDSSTIKRSDFSKTLEGTEFMFDVGLGGEGTLTAFKGGVLGLVYLVGGLSTRYTVPTRAVATFTAAPFIALTGAIGVLGPWNGVLRTFHRSYIWDGVTFNPPSFNAAIPKGPVNSSVALLPSATSSKNVPSAPVCSSKDDLIRTISQALKNRVSLREQIEGVSIREEVEYVKKPFTGTGSVYEGKPILGDISADVYNDGVPSVARSGSGDIMAVWAKAFASSALGTKIYSARYTQKGWSSVLEVTPGIDFHKDPAIVFDSHGKPLAVWSSAPNEGLDYERSSAVEILEAIDKADLMYSWHEEGKWTAPKLLAALPGLDDQVDLAAGPDGKITAVWINQSGKSSRLYGSLWNGTCWTWPKCIAQAVLAESPEITYAAGRPSVVWAQDTDGKIETTDDWRMYIADWSGTSWHSQALSVDGKKREQGNGQGSPGKRNLPARRRGKKRGAALFD
ncbi:MAG: hypothetical protein AB1847_11445 [bacterium]